MLHDRGADPWVVDFGSPEHEEGGLERAIWPTTSSPSPTPSTGCARSPARTSTWAATRRGGMFCYQAAAYRRAEGIDR